MQFSIPKDVYCEIVKSIPEFNHEAKPLFYRDFLFNMHDLIHGSSLGISLVCLRDAYFRLDESKISLHSAYVQKIYYNKFHDGSPLNIESIRFAKYHLDYIPLNLYVFQEDIAEFILKYNSLDEIFSKWKKLPKTGKYFEKKRVVSNAAKVGIFLKTEKPEIQFTPIIFDLVQNENWKKAIKYRNSWVHEKPPIIEGLGIQHNRESRINIEEKRRTFGFGGSTKPDYTINELFEICTKAIEVGIKAINDIITIIDKDEKEIHKNINLRFNSEGHPYHSALISTLEPQEI